MKRIIYSFLLAAVAMPAMAQLDRSIRPQPSEAREPEIAEYKKYELDNGLKMIVVENHKLPRLSIQLSLNIDPVFEGDKVGMVSMAGDILSEGTTNRTKEQLDEEIDFMGASISTYSSGAFATGLSKYSDKLTELLADVVLHPSFPADEFEKLKQQGISSLRANEDDPGALMSNLYDARIYGLDHPFGEVTTQESVNNITLEDCRNYWSTYFRPNVAYIAVVGDIKPRDAKKLIEKYFASWEQGEVPSHEIEVPQLPESTQVALINRPTSVQTEIRIGNRVELSQGDPDLEAVRVANMILGGGSLARLYLNLREDKSYTYGAYSSIGTSQYVSDFTAQAAVRNEVTDSAVAEFLYEINRIRTELVSEEELQGAKNYLAGSFGRSLESAQTVASFGLNIERYGLDEDYYNDYLKRLQAVTAEDVMRAAQKYFANENLTIAVVGRASDIEEGLKRFGEVSRYDRYARPASDAVSVPEGLTAAQVLSDYYAAMGGREKLNSITGYISSAKGSVQGMEISVSEMWMAPDMYKQSFSTPMGGQEVVVKGEEVTLMANGASQPVPDEEKSALIAEAQVFELTDLTGAEMTLLPEVAEVNGTEAYGVEVTTAAGTKTHYFSTESGLRIRTSETQETPRGTVTMNVDIKQYSEVDGVKLPSVYTLPLGPMSVDMTVQDIQLNPSELSASDF